MQTPFFVQTEQYTRAEGISGSGGAADVVCGELEGGLPEVITSARAGKCAFGKMDHNHLTDALLQQCPGGVAEGDGVEAIVRMADFEAGGLTGFDLVEDAIIHVFEGGTHDFGETIAIFADDIDAGFDAGGLRAGEEAGGFGAEFCVRLIQGVEQEQIAEMKNARFYFGKIEIFTVPKRVRAAGVEESAAAMALFGHDIGVGGGCFGSGAEMPHVNLVLAAIIEDLVAKGVLADEARAEERERDAGFGEVNQDIVRSAAGSLGLAANVSELFGLRIDVDQFDLVDDPIPASEEPAMGI